ncbi:MAG TPA: 1,4-alpha-glucan branching protein domain-containing protein [Solirubrobacteraceae bacterium]|nr:1,4-alpha-glucan branching protein domain-containing protein [Solirubrobacteraceae bacterium]
MPAVTDGRDRGALAIVLHTHMPYVEGFGTWPFGEEWLWEAIAGSYLLLLELLDAGAPLTLSLTPVLCDQLEAPRIAERFGEFVLGTRQETHREDAAGLRAGGHEQLARELERSWGEYRTALDRFEACGGQLLGALGRHAQWTSAATHAVLPLLASDAGVHLQVSSGVQAHRRRFGEGWRGGFWLPECAYAPWLERALEDAGVSAVCVELTALLGPGAPEHLRPIATDGGFLLVPIDRATMSLVWSDEGYPAHGAYRDYHHHTVHHHNPWNNRGEAYDHEEALAIARGHAADFVARVCARLDGAVIPGGGLVVCALDTELLGHWWYEGVVWLEEVVHESARQGLELVRLDDALERCKPRAISELPGAGEWAPSSWGLRGDLSTWSSPAVADMAFAARAAELEVLAAGERASPVAVRELLALQASDWPFMVSREIAVPYAQERFEGHRLALGGALHDPRESRTDGLGNLAIDADRSALLAP